MKKIKTGDILLFYASHDKMAITTLGVVDAVFTNFKKEELENISRKDSLVILFKHYITFEKPIDLDYLQEKEIIKGNIQRPRSIENKSIVDILNYSKKDYSKIEVS